MHPQKEYQPDPEAVLRHEKEHDAIMDKVYDTEHNKWLHLFHRLYQTTSILFCLFLIALLLVTVSYLPAIGSVTNRSTTRSRNVILKKGWRKLARSISLPA